MIQGRVTRETLSPGLGRNWEGEMGNRNVYYNNQGQFFQGVPAVVQITVPDITDLGEYDVTPRFNGIIVDAKFTKDASAWPADNAITFTSILRNGTSNVVSQSVNFEGAAPSSVSQFPIDLASIEVQAGGILRATTKNAGSGLGGVLTVTILPTD